MKRLPVSKRETRPSGPLVGTCPFCSAVGPHRVALKGPHTQLSCGKCGGHIRWLNKAEKAALRTVEVTPEKVLKKESGQRMHPDDLSVLAAATIFALSDLSDDAMSDALDAGKRLVEAAQR